MSSKAHLLIEQDQLTSHELEEVCAFEAACSIFGSTGVKVAHIRGEDGMLGWHGWPIGQQDQMMQLEVLV